jgi:hypothetical protein
MSTQVANCKECNRIFTSVGGLKVCMKCREVHEEEFKAVRDFLYENPEASLKDAQVYTAVPHESIMVFIKEGRIKFKTGGMHLNCERCDALIESGRFCDACQYEMAKSLGDAGRQIASSITETNKRDTKRAFHSKK